MHGAARQPRITVIGVYSAKASAKRFERFIEEYLKRAQDSLTEVGIKAPISDGRSVKIASDLRSTLGSAALVEVLVENPDDRFRVRDFAQQDAKQPKGQWQVAWEEAFLTLDGKNVVARREGEVPALRAFRVAFYIHLWKHGEPLLSSYGPLPYPKLAPLPERLWRLAPYALVD